MRAEVDEHDPRSFASQLEGQQADDERRHLEALDRDSPRANVPGSTRARLNSGRTRAPVRDRCWDVRARHEARLRGVDLGELQRSDARARQEPAARSRRPPDATHDRRPPREDEQTDADDESGGQARRSVPGEILEHRAVDGACRVDDPASLDLLRRCVRLVQDRPAHEGKLRRHIRRLGDELVQHRIGAGAPELAPPATCAAPMLAVSDASSASSVAFRLCSAVMHDRRVGAGRRACGTRGTRAAITSVRRIASADDPALAFHGEQVIAHDRPAVLREERVR